MFSKTLKVASTIVLGIFLATNAVYSYSYYDQYRSKAKQSYTYQQSVSNSNYYSQYRKTSAQNTNQKVRHYANTDHYDTREKNFKTLFQLTPRGFQHYNSYIRLAPNDYADGKSKPAGHDRPSARAISNAIFDQPKSMPNTQNLSSYFRQWGQFIDHDIALTKHDQTHEQLPIAIPQGDPYFDPQHAGNKKMDMTRSNYSYQNSVREQTNSITALIDASMVYGSSTLEAKKLRTNDGSGQMKTSKSANGEVVLPKQGTMFHAGDERASEQPGLTAMHTLFVREHNHQANKIKKAIPDLSGDKIYYMAREIVTAEIQAITYREYLPIVLGQSLPRYKGYQSHIDPSISNEFATAAFRFGHTQLPSTIQRIDAYGKEASEGHLKLKDAFFQPQHVAKYGVDSIIRGLNTQKSETIDNKVIHDVRNMLFGAPGAGGFDLAALNIQRGRDHGLASYNTVRKSLGLKPLYNIDQMQSDGQTKSKLKQLYGDVNNIDLRVAGLSEKPYGRSVLGETFYHILKDQFTRLRDGDKDRYENRLDQRRIQFINQQTLHTIILRNTSIQNGEINNNVFYTQSRYTQNHKYKKRSTRKKINQKHYYGSSSYYNKQAYNKINNYTRENYYQNKKLRVSVSTQGYWQ